LPHTIVGSIVTVIESVTTTTNILGVPPVLPGRQ
jgi:hypothetical protein